MNEPETITFSFVDNEYETLFTLGPIEKRNTDSLSLHGCRLVTVDRAVYVLVPLGTVGAPLDGPREERR